MDRMIRRWGEDGRAISIPRFVMEIFGWDIETNLTVTLDLRRRQMILERAPEGLPGNNLDPKARRKSTRGRRVVIAKAKGKVKS